MSIVSIRSQGAVIVNDAHVVAQSDRIVCLSVDLTSKRAVISSHMQFDGLPALELSADANTLHLDATKGRDDATIIAFRTFEGWRVFAADVSRYTLSVCLLREAE